MVLQNKQFWDIISSMITTRPINLSYMYPVSLYLSFWISPHYGSWKCGKHIWSFQRGMDTCVSMDIYSLMWFSSKANSRSTEWYNVGELCRTTATTTSHKCSLLEPWTYSDVQAWQNAEGYKLYSSSLPGCCSEPFQPPLSKHMSSFFFLVCSPSQAQDLILVSATPTQTYPNNDFMYYYRLLLGAFCSLWRHDLLPKGVHWNCMERICSI